MQRPGGSDGNESACSAVDPSLIPPLGRSLEKGMATLSNIFAWRIPWTEEPSGLPSTGLQRIGHNWVTNTFTFHNTKELQVKQTNKQTNKKTPHHLLTLRHTKWNFPGGPVVKNLPASAESMGSIPDLGRCHMLWSNQAHVSQLLKLLHPTVCLCNKRSPCTATRE